MAKIQTGESGSVRSYPRRNPDWGDWRYPGNCAGEFVRDLVLQYRPETISDPMSGSGTSRDVARSLRREGYQCKYWGSDLKDGFDLLEHDPPTGADLVFLHPPYWNMIRYSDDPRDLSTCGDYSDFLEKLCCCLRRCYGSLKSGGRLAVLVGDHRRNGRYTAIVNDVLNMQVGDLSSILIKVQHNCRSDSKQYSLKEPRIEHEYCPVFKR